MRSWGISRESHTGCPRYARSSPGDIESLLGIRSRPIASGASADRPARSEGGASVPAFGGPIAEPVDQGRVVRAQSPSGQPREGRDRRAPGASPGDAERDPTSMRTRIAAADGGAVGYVINYIN